MKNAIKYTTLLYALCALWAFAYVSYQNLKFAPDSLSMHSDMQMYVDKYVYSKELQTYFKESNTITLSYDGRFRATSSVLKEKASNICHSSHHVVFLRHNIFAAFADKERASIPLESDLMKSNLAYSQPLNIYQVLYSTQHMICTSRLKAHTVQCRKIIK
ncbi:exported hypothetical protein [Vibrio nigripulchritudo MADA3029]|uniref:hypothetical protein n=1 Tax=Vibrio nigripulchritudo TaxID=28173 RepID=UPI0003B1A1E5|nr:hypothetical protein [Vibrio nigripulchritudo]CCN50796.1 exported hypothetical protein [Vibrio nigripulchritudo MADA3020]CCN56654.1 exported hypothetical protein [Vibrio nigripulchritudo MADA3021]CCN62511.1 exported hypothetical protein [Vibrio nigripulchritudo MADA3029]